MGCYRIKGGAKLEGEVAISGSKNSSLPIIAACLLNGGVTQLYNVPNIKDTAGMFEILNDLGCKIKKKGKRIIVDSTNIKKFEIDDALMSKMRSSAFLGFCSPVIVIKVCFINLRDIVRKFVLEFPARRSVRYNGQHYKFVLGK